MTILPENFPADLLPSVERYKVEAYYEQFVTRHYREYGMGHFWLACYAALPAVVTPDLLYKIWLNFSEYEDGDVRQIHHIAVADLLLSSIFTEIGHETYEMQVEVKNAFLKYWKAELDDDNYYELYTIDDIAKFLLGYTKVYRTNDLKGDDAFREAQQITAWSYLDTKKAEDLLLQSLEKANQQSKAAPDDQFAKSEQMRLLEFNRQTVARQDLGIMATGQSKQKGMDTLVGFSQQMQSLMEGNEAAILKLVEQSDGELELSDEPQGNLSFKAPASIIRKLQPDSVAQKETKYFLILVGVNQYTNPSIESLNGCLQDVENMRTALESHPIPNKHLYVALDQEASIAEIRAAFSEQLELAGPFDQMIFYFSGHTSLVQDQLNLMLYDSPSRDQGLPLTDLLQELTTRENRAPYVTFVIDSPHSVKSLPNEKTAFLAGGGSQGVEHNPFTDAFSKIYTRSKGRVSLQKLMAATAHELNNQQSKVPSRGLQDSPRSAPQLLAYPATAKHPLIRSNEHIRDMQYLLRSSTFYYNGSANGVYNETTDKALRSFLQDYPIEGRVTPTAILNNLKLQKKNREAENPFYFLFVYASPEDKPLPSVQQEYEQMQALSAQVEEISGAEVILLKDPSRAELYEYFRAPSYRNSLRYFHFSGYETDPTGSSKQRGMFLQSGEARAVIDYTELHKWLDFQENLQLVFLSSCFSKELAQLLLIRGIPAIICAEAYIVDEYAATFAHQFYQNMVNGLSLQEAFTQTAARPDGNTNQKITRAINLDDAAEETSFSEFEILYSPLKESATVQYSWARQQEAEPATDPNSRLIEHFKALGASMNIDLLITKLTMFYEVLPGDGAKELNTIENKYQELNRSIEEGTIIADNIPRDTTNIINELLQLVDKIESNIAAGDGMSSDGYSNIPTISAEEIDHIINTAESPNKEEESVENVPLFDRMVQYLKRLVTEGENDQLIELLQQLVSGIDDEEFSNDLTILAGNYRRNQKKYSSGIVTNQEYEVNNNKNRAGILSIISQLQENSTLQDRIALIESDYPDPINERSIKAIIEQLSEIDGSSTRDTEPTTPDLSPRITDFLRGLIANEEIEQALELVTEFAEVGNKLVEEKREGLLTNAITLNAQHKRNKRNFQSDILTDREYFIEKDKTTESARDLINELESLLDDIPDLGLLEHDFPGAVNERAAKAIIESLNQKVESTTTQSDYGDSSADSHSLPNRISDFLKRLLSEDELEQVLSWMSQLVRIVNELNDDDAITYETNVILTQRRFNRNEDSFRKGLVNHENYNVEKNKCRHIILELIIEIPNLLNQIPNIESYIRDSTKELNVNSVQEIVTNLNNGIKQNEVTPLRRIQYELKNSIAKDQLHKAIPNLGHFFSEKSNLHNEFLLISQKYNQLNLENVRGVINHEQNDVTLNKISSDLIDLINKLQVNDIEDPQNIPTPPKQGFIFLSIPTNMDLKSEAKCVIRVADDEKILMEEMKGNQPYEILETQLTEVMEVQVNAENEKSLNIRSLNEQSQFVDKDDLTEWSFFLNASTTGEMRLFLKLANIILVNEKEEKLETVLERTINVV